MAWTEDRWMVTVRNDDGSKTEVQSSRHGQGKRWRVRYDDPDGRSRAKSFTRKPDAERFRTGVEADLLRGTYLDPEAGKITLARFAEQWLANQTFDDSTRESLAGRIRHINDGLGGKTLAQLASSPSAVQAWLRGLKLSPRTVRHCLSTLSTICSAAVDDGRMGRNPCRMRSVKAPAVPEYKVRPLEAAELAAIRGALPARWRPMADAGALCGMRQGEILGFAVEDIDFLRRTVQVRRQIKIVAGKMVFALPKGGKTRSVPLAARASESFAEHIRLFPPVRITLPWHQPGSRDHGKPREFWLLFTTPRSRKPVERHGLNARTWHDALKAAGLPVSRENGMHVLRHTYASMLLHNGVSIRQLADCLGHTDPGFTLRVYTHLMEGGEESVRRALDLAMTVPSPDCERSDIG